MTQAVVSRADVDTEPSGGAEPAEHAHRAGPIIEQRYQDRAAGEREALVPRAS